MRAQYFAAAALFATSAVATSTWTRVTSPVDSLHGLRIRQSGGSFEPEGRKDVCPNGSGCLTNGRCCPDTEGPEGCLAQLTKTNIPTYAPPVTPTEYPTPTDSPTEPTEYPTETPTETPTEYPTETPTETPTEYPTDAPTETDDHCDVPTDYPTDSPTDSPTGYPTGYPTGTDAPPYPTNPPSEPTYPVHPTGGSPSEPTETPPYEEGGANSLKVVTGASALLALISFIQNAL
ncbi:hypothetical protein GX51_05163 [Blastomyces parvus]|uniref:Uncharacterized protein n=1 Tax=Blastomyces parvus TaxID=2060905 RepID=A0A2B7WYV3_9EURO|nr:hypothetical protein GX51_05163 [Blastomyces parvus]